jgi:hypothetical protein
LAALAVADTVINTMIDRFRRLDAMVNAAW